MILREEYDVGLVQTDPDESVVDAAVRYALGWARAEFPEVDWNYQARLVGTTVTVTLTTEDTSLVATCDTCGTVSSVRSQEVKLNGSRLLCDSCYNNGFGGLL